MPDTYSPDQVPVPDPGTAEDPPEPNLDDLAQAVLDTARAWRRSYRNPDDHCRAFDAHCEAVDRWLAAEKEAGL